VTPGTSPEIGETTIGFSGDPTPEEIAAVTMVLVAVSHSPDAEERPAQVGLWADPARRLRQAIPAGPGAWRSSLSY
jgi:hypothetical protein